MCDRGEGRRASSFVLRASGKSILLSLLVRFGTESGRTNFCSLFLFARFSPKAARKHITLASSLYKFLLPHSLRPSQGSRGEKGLETAAFHAPSGQREKLRDSSCMKSLDGWSHMSKGLD